MSEILQEISEKLQAGKRKDVKNLCQQAIDEGLKADEILSGGLLAGMDVIGVKFKANEIFVPQVLVAARAMAAGSEVLKPHLAAGDATSKGKVVIGTVKGDLHDIGKNLCTMMIEGKGLDVVDLGVDVEPQAFVDEAIKTDADVICCSALLTTTMPVMKDVVDAVKEAGLADKVKVFVGGAPVTDEYAKSVGADFYTEDAPTCADKIVEVLSAKA